jgi:hypothetical protein
MSNERLIMDKVLFLSNRYVSANSDNVCFFNSIVCLNHTLIPCHFKDFTPAKQYFYSNHITQIYGINPKFQVIQISAINRKRHSDTMVGRCLLVLYSRILTNKTYYGRFPPEQTSLSLWECLTSVYALPLAKLPSAPTQVPEQLV